MGSELKPPNTLRRHGKRLFEDIVSGWNVQPEHLTLLVDLAECQDRISELSGILREQGQLLKDRYGHPKQHPASAMLKAEVGNFTRLWSALALEVPGGSDVGPGRPPGWAPEE
jgi:hypothetical protein